MIRALGVSNVSVNELKEHFTSGDVASDQIRYSMLLRDAEIDILPYCHEHNMAGLTYMLLEQGLLAGKIRMHRTFGKDEIRSNADWNAWFIPENRHRILSMFDGWHPLIEKYRCTLAQLVLAWTAAQPGVTYVLVGSRRVGHAVANALAANLQPTVDDLWTIRHDVEELGQPKSFMLKG